MREETFGPLMPVMPFDTIDEAAGLTNPRVSAIAEDRNGLIYFGTWSGVCLYRGDRIVALDLDPEHKSEIVTAIAQGRLAAEAADARRAAGQV